MRSFPPFIPVDLKCFFINDGADGEGNGGDFILHRPEEAMEINHSKAYPLGRETATLHATQYQLEHF
ncbi:Hypothetical protein FKW44_005216 [Caligus rogercresseyi]|uniref:Uncharacterized protein n=1 Tax=Caligus rogercresseyi TaxID=217165 RepID=A0A7T8KBM9_CALRO|nr:Hypothetical protein FKW44_005216 [Caligus rogercresseyi]